MTFQTSAMNEFTVSKINGEPVKLDPAKQALLKMNSNLKEVYLRRFDQLVMIFMKDQRK